MRYWDTRKSIENLIEKLEFFIEEEEILDEEINQLKKILFPKVDFNHFETVEKFNHFIQINDKYSAQEFINKLPEYQ